jgi:hypothetical protein
MTTTNGRDELEKEERMTTTGRDELETEERMTTAGRDELEREERMATAGRDELDDDEGDDELEDNLVIDGSPGDTMEVEDVDPLEEVLTGPADEAEISPTINLPRKPTAAEARQRFMAYRLPDGSQRYICLVCEKMYTSRYNIRMHMNLHTGNNVHTCRYCGRKFAHKHVYESHLRTHTGERPFACEKCERKFGDRSNCASHMKRCGLHGNSSNYNNSDSSASSPVVKQEKEEEEEEKTVDESRMMPGSISIAPNVSLTPISKLKNPEENKPRLFHIGPAFTAAGFAAVPLSGGGVANGYTVVGQPPQVVMLNFQPQIVAVQSLSAAMPIAAMPIAATAAAVPAVALAATTTSSNNNNSEDFVNMGYLGEEDDTEEEEVMDDSEEVMIEPDISLDYDDIEEMEDRTENPGGMVDKQVLYFQRRYIS